MNDVVPVSSPAIPERMVLGTPLTLISFFSTKTIFAVMFTIISSPCRSAIFLVTAVLLTEDARGALYFFIMPLRAASMAIPYWKMYFSSSVRIVSTGTFPSRRSARS